MVTIASFKKLALSYPETIELPHFENLSYRVNKKIFVTLSEKNKRACVKLSEIDQSVFSAFDKTTVFPVPNKWGKQGWTFVELSKVRKEMLKDLLTTAYCSVAPKRLSKIFLNSENL
ncbi:MAG: MmcQ/YjbR family DNA-binding protein [Bacteroidota bacterium]